MTYEELEEAFDENGIDYGGNLKTYLGIDSNNKNQMLNL